MSTVVRAVEDRPAIEETDRDPGEAYLRELQLGLAELGREHSDALTAATTMDVHEVGAFRVANFAARLPAFSHYGEPDEGTILQRQLIAHLTSRKMPPPDAAAALQPLLEPHLGYIREVADFNDRAERLQPRERLAANLAAARGIISRTIREFSVIPTSEVHAWAQRIFGDNVPADEPPTQQHLRVMMHLVKLRNSLQVDLESLTASTSSRTWLQSRRFDPEQGWIGVAEPPEHYQARFDAVQRPLLEAFAAEQVRKAQEAARMRELEKLDRAPLPQAPGDRLAIIGHAARAGWVPDVDPERQEAVFGREYLVFGDPYIRSARHFLLYRPQASNGEAHAQA